MVIWCLLFLDSRWGVYLSILLLFPLWRNGFMRMDGLVVVVPCFNVGCHIAQVVDSALLVVPRLVVVDDGSSDGATDLLDEQSVDMIRFEVNRGKGAALLAGFRKALEDSKVTAVVVIDADGQHDPAEIPKLYEAFVQQKADLVIGERRFDFREVPWLSWIGNTLTCCVMGWLSGVTFGDTQSGFRLHSRALLERVLAEIGPGRYETETQILMLAVRGGYKVVSVPVATIYEQGNPTSHFRRVRDSWRVWRALFGSALGRK